MPTDGLVIVWPPGTLGSLGQMYVFTGVEAVASVATL